MRLVELTCSGCGAKLDVDVDQERCFCKYCGKEFILDKEIQYFQEVGGYENEYGKTKGRLDAQRAFMEEQEQARKKAQQEAYEKAKQESIKTADKLLGFLRPLSLGLGALGVIGIIIGIIVAIQGHGGMGIVASVITIVAGIGTLLFLSAKKNLMPAVIITGLSMVLNLAASMSCSALYLIVLAANVVTFIFVLRVMIAEKYRS